MASTASCFRTCTAIISAGFRSCSSTASSWAERERPLLIAGPPGTRARLDALLEVFFPRSTGNKWRFSWEVLEIEVGRPTDVLGHSVTTTEVVHFSGAPSTALRLSDGQKLFAYSGDTEWVEALVAVADGADLFIVECYGYSGRMSGHLTWEILQARLPDLRARQIMITHMNPSMLARQDEARAAGVLVAQDGLVIEIEREAGAVRYRALCRHAGWGDRHR